MRRLPACTEGDVTSTTAASGPGRCPSSAALYVRFRFRTGVVSGVGGSLLVRVLILVEGLLGVIGKVGAGTCESWLHELREAGCVAC